MTAKKDEKTTAEDRKMCGKIMSMLIKIGKGYSLKPGMYGMYNILDRNEKVVTTGSLGVLYARVESMLKEKEKADGNNV